MTVLSDGRNWHEIVSCFLARFSISGSPIRELLDVKIDRPS